MTRKIQRAVTLMATGYEILRPRSGTSPAFGTDALLGKPATAGTAAGMHPPYRLTREVFGRYRAEAFIARKPYQGRSAWEVWLITDQGRAEAKARPNPSRDEIRAARAAMKAERGR